VLCLNELPVRGALTCIRRRAGIEDEALAQKELAKKLGRQIAGQKPKRKVVKKKSDDDSGDDNPEEKKKSAPKAPRPRRRTPERIAKARRRAGDGF